MSADWIAALTRTLATGEDAVLVTVARTQGSTPREAGATMVVGRSGALGSVGGGHLEWQAIGQAHRLLAAERRWPEVGQFKLGARLGQCCGGIVWLVFEVIEAATRASWEARLAAVRNGKSLRRALDSGRDASVWTIAEVRTREAAQLAGDAEHWRLRQEIAEHDFPVHLFGAGHVAQALVRQLVPLGARIAWIDSREEAFAGLDTVGINALVTDAPEAEVPPALPGTYFLVMTHSHALDFTLCEAIFRRHDFAYFGLIGSRSKRASFEHRLSGRGLTPERFHELTCPIGISGIVSKEPAAIALSIAAQLLQVHCARNLVAQAGRTGRIGAKSLPE